MSSTVGLEGRPYCSVYSASKHAIAGFTDSLRLELVPAGIKVTGIYPGAAQTKFRSKGDHTENFIVSDEKWMRPEEIAEVICFIMTRPERMLIDKIVLRNMP